MSDKSHIQWTEATWNPVTGCTKVSQGCKHCYAKHQAWPRLKASPQTVYFGREFEDVQCHPERLRQPLSWKKPRRIFVNSMSDLFHEDVPFEFIASVFAVMGHSTRHQYQILTKRPERMQAFFRWALDGLEPDDFSADDRIMEHWPGEWEGYDNCGPRFPYENVWLGVSVEDQATADERIPLLLQTPAAVRWISAEPLLGPVDLGAVRRPWGYINALRTGFGGTIGEPAESWGRLDWVVAGGESGPNARPCHPDWARSLRDQCQAAGVPFFFKQWGEWAPISELDETEALYRPNRKANDYEDQGALNELYGETCRVATGILGIDGTLMECVAGAFHADRKPMQAFRVGKRAAGRLLDGRTWDEYPEVPA